MSIKCQPGGFKLDFGSTVTILTTAACSPRKHSSQGIFTGVVLDDTDTNFERTAKHLTITVDSDYFEDEQKDEGEDQYAFQGAKYPINEDKKGSGWTKYCKDKESGEWYKDGIDKCEDKCHKPHQEKECCEPKHEDKCHKPDKDKECCEHKHEHKCPPKGKDEYLLLSLTCPSYPFHPGQLVWINIEEIVALTVICKK